MNLTIIIPVADDTRIKNCIESIDENVEILVVLNGATKKVKNIIKDFKNIETLEIYERNLGMARDEGVNKAKFDKVLLMDSDCIFQKGCIKKLYNGLKKYKIAKGKVIFNYNNMFNKIIKKTREYTTSDFLSAYAPPLAFDKTVKKEIGGYYFDRDIHWADDAEFDKRVKKGGIKINYLPSAIIYHPPLNFFQDLRSAFRYGCGQKIGTEKNIMNGIDSFFPCVFDITKKKGFLSGLYMIVWNISYCSGYFIQKLLDIYRIKDKINLYIL